MSALHHCWGHAGYPEDVDYPRECACEIGTDHDHDDWLIERRPEMRRIPREMCVSATPVAGGTDE